MKRVTVLLSLLMITLLVCASAGCAEIIPAYGEGQIGLQAVVLCDSLTVREMPGSSSRAVTTLRYGARIIVQPETGGWARCFLSDAEDVGPAGYVNEEYLAIDPAWYRTERSTPVYAWNDTNAPKVALLSRNTTLPILREVGNWLVVSLRGASGWIHK
ncbi:MAG: SH3 domain-containing protein [Clostridia bacterium]|nr:SH3 domain-containing protein [Clostridia bacterium]